MVAPISDGSKTSPLKAMNEMTDEQINVAVAECCGWTNVRMDYANGSDTFKSFLGNKPGFVNGPPFYSGSRDAMAGALEMLSPELRNDFIAILWKECGNEARSANFWTEYNFRAFWSCLTATPKQLAIAFLKAKGKL